MNTTTQNHQFHKPQPNPLLLPTVLITFEQDTNSPSGVRLKLPAGSRVGAFRYYLAGSDRSAFFAENILDLVVQTTKEASAINGKMFVMDRWEKLLAMLLTNLLSGLDSPEDTIKLLEAEFNILIARE